MRKLFRNFMLGDSERSPRQATPPVVTYYYDGETATPSAHQIQNISATGLYLFTERRWYPGTLITMTLQMTAGAGPENTIAVLAKAVRAGSDGVAFQFIFPAARDARDAHNVDGSRLVDKKTLNRFLRRLR